LVNAQSLALSLTHLGRVAEAKHVIEHALDTARGSVPDLHAQLLAQYAELAGASPARYNPLIEEAARAWNLLGPADRLENPAGRLAVIKRVTDHLRHSGRRNAQ